MSLAFVPSPDRHDRSRSAARRKWLELQPYERSRCAEHGGSCDDALRDVPLPPWVVMVALSEVPCNASRGRNAKAVLQEDGGRARPAAV